MTRGLKLSYEDGRYDQDTEWLELPDLFSLDEHDHVPSTLHADDLSKRQNRHRQA